MARKLFGTDGIRGRTNIEPMTAETALKVAMAAATQLRRGDHRHRVVIAKDTRLSGYMLEPALAAGLSFLWPGLGQLLLGRRIAAAVLLCVLVAVLFVPVYSSSRTGGRKAASMLERREP